MTFPPFPLARIAAVCALTLILAAAGATAGASDALAKNDKAKGKGQGQGQSQSQNTGDSIDESLDDATDQVIDGVLDGVFGTQDREIIETYSREKGVGTKSLPPGIAKNVQRGKPLPPGIAKRGLPTDLERQLSPLEEGLERIIVGDDVTIVEEGTRIVVDVLKDVLTRQANQ